MRKGLIVIALAIAFLVGMAGAANYMYEKATVKGVGYKNVEMIASTQWGFAGAKLVEKESGSGNVITERTELEAERQLSHDYSWLPYECGYPTGTDCPMDYINFTKEAEFEYMPVSYQTGTYDQKWVEKLCVQNYRIGAVLTEMYSHAEHLQKTTEVKTRAYGFQNVPDQTLFDIGDVFFAPPPIQNGGTFNRFNPDPNMVSETYKNGYWTYKVTQGGQYDNTVRPPLGRYETPSAAVIQPGFTEESLCIPCCTGVLEANLNSNVIGVAHIGWLSRDPLAENNLKGRHAEYGRSVEDLTGVFSIEKFIQLWGNSTCGAISVDWLPCV